jgi:selenocysteine-specific elongation factor
LQGLIIGTAGHIDHGKTQLIKALTGTDTDRLKEEKERGISIELGFAEFPLPDGTPAGVVDVPGHEHFVKNMLAGATGFDLVLLVVAADDGVMPQTREHLAIIDLLQVREGLVIVTKADLADSEMVELVREEVDELLAGTTLEGAEVITTSTVTGQGLDELKEALMRAAGRVRARRGDGPFRLPVDRVFTLKGIGTVVTGTLWEGSVSDGDEAVLEPQGRAVRVRNVQVHGKEVEAALAGQRVALNLPGIATGEIDRGDVVVSAGYLSPTFMVDARLHLLQSAPRPLKNRSRIRFHHATREVLGRVILLREAPEAREVQELAPGDSAYVQFRLEAPVVVKYGDRFILRSYSPVTTIGGGQVLDSHPPKHRRVDPGLLEALAVRERGEVAGVLQSVFDGQGVPLDPESLERLSEMDPQTVRATAERLLEEGAWRSIPSERKTKLMPEKMYDAYAEKITGLLKSFHQANPREAGMEKETLRTRLPRSLPAGDFDAMLKLLQEGGAVTVKEGRVTMRGEGRALTVEETREKQSVLADIEAGGFAPPFLKELAETHRLDARKARDFIGMLMEEGAIEQVTQDYYLARGRLAEAEEGIRAFLAEHGRLEVKDLKEMYGLTRKYSIPLLEHFDRSRVTRRDGDYRVLW